jgi:hypothetical protein
MKTAGEPEWSKLQLNWWDGGSISYMHTDSNINIHTTVKTTAQIRFHSKRPNTITHMNNIKMDSTLAGSINTGS